MTVFLNKKRIIFAAMLIAVCICGCGVKQETMAEAVSTSKKEEQVLTEYSTRQLFTLIRSEQERIASVYTDQVFDVSMGEDGATYKDNFLIMMKDYIIKLYTMVDMADARGIELSKEEQAKVEADADTYVEKLKKKDDNIAISREEVAELMTDILRVQKLREDIISKANIEISENEARVQDVQRIVCDSSDDANAAITAINNGTDFMLVAREYSIDGVIEIECAREDLDPVYADTVFALSDGEVTSVINTGGRYYIFKCISGYNEEATAKHKEQLIEERQNKAIATEYDSQELASPRAIDPATWTMAVRLFSSKAVADNIFEYLEE